MWYSYLSIFRTLSSWSDLSRFQLNRCTESKNWNNSWTARKLLVSVNCALNKYSFWLQLITYRISARLENSWEVKCNLNYISNKLTSFHCDIYWSWGPCSLKKMGKLVEKLNTKKEVTDARESKERKQTNDFFLKYVYIPGIQNREIKKVKCKMRLTRDLLHEIIKRKAENEKILTPSLSKRTMIFSSFLTCES